MSKRTRDEEMAWKEKAACKARQGLLTHDTYMHAHDAEWIRAYWSPWMQEWLESTYYPITLPNLQLTLHYVWIHNRRDIRWNPMLETIPIPETWDKDLKRLCKEMRLDLWHWFSHGQKLDDIPARIASAIWKSMRIASGIDNIEVK